MKPIDEKLCAAPVEIVARALVGKLIQRQEVLLRITEVEAYAGPEDSASHARFGLTKRNAVMFGPPGYAYVYLCYGVHNMLNVVAEPEPRAAAVLIRAAELISGRETVQKRRGQPPGPKWLAGPGKVAQALALGREHTGLCLLGQSELTLLDDGAAPRITTSARIGIDFARPKDRRRRWRFADADSPSRK